MLIGLCGFFRYVWKGLLLDNVLLWGGVMFGGFVVCWLCLVDFVVLVCGVCLWFLNWLDVGYVGVW